MKLLFCGDIMLGRFVSEKYKVSPYDVVSEDVRNIAIESDYVIANLESPITAKTSNNILAFAGGGALLSHFKWINMFSLANNHINDFGEEGIIETVKALDEVGISYNGIFEEDYMPYIIEKKGIKVAIVSCTDVLNIEFGNNYKYKILRADSPDVNSIIQKYNEQGYFTILFSHCGSVFTRFPNPKIRDILYSAIDAGARCVITCHSHCLGGFDIYKDVPIFYSLGDFLMDGSSFRRRRAGVLQLEINNNSLKKWLIVPTITNMDLQTILPTEKQRINIMRGFERVSKKMQRHHDNYYSFYKWQYKAEILSHSLSTLRFLYKSKGIVGFFKMLAARFVDVKRMIHRMIFDRSNDRYDTDGLSKLKNSDIQ